MKDLVPPWLFSKWEESRDAYLKTGKTQSYEYELNARKGLSFFEARLTGCGEDEFYVVIRDISSRKKAEQKLIASEERYRTILRSGRILKDIIWTIILLKINSLEKTLGKYFIINKNQGNNSGHITAKSFKKIYLINGGN